MDNTADNRLEIWDLYDKDRKLTGRIHVRGESLGPDDYHLVVHVCIFNRQGQLLIQQRQPWKIGWPDMWDVSAAGSALAGETSKEAAEREVREELGLDILLEDERPRFTINFQHGFDDYWITQQNVPVDQLHLQAEEVKQVKWVDKKELHALLRQGKFIPYFFLDQLFDMKDTFGSHL